MINRLLCSIFGHIHYCKNRQNGDIWGWNSWHCKRCKKQFNSIMF